jgi:hypothetical protein
MLVPLGQAFLSYVEEKTVRLNTYAVVEEDTRRIF